MDEDVVWFFKEKMIKAAKDTNNIMNNSSNGGNSANVSRTESSKNLKMIEEEDQE